MTFVVLWVWPPPSNSGKWVLVEIPYWTCNNFDGHCYREGAWGGPQPSCTWTKRCPPNHPTKWAPTILTEAVTFLAPFFFSCFHSIKGYTTSLGVIFHLYKWSYEPLVMSPSLKLTVRTWKWMVKILISFWDSAFSGAKWLLLSGSVINPYNSLLEPKNNWFPTPFCTCPNEVKNSSVRG